MDNNFIYIVGKSFDKNGITERAHQLGFKVGLLADIDAKPKNIQLYDRVEYINFNALDQEIAHLHSKDLRAAGLLCIYENYIVAKAKIGQYLKLKSLSVSSALLSTDKLLMRGAFMKYDPSITPNFQSIETLEQALEFADSHGYPLIIKPTNLVKSLLVLKCSNRTQLIENFNHAQASVHELYRIYKIRDHVPQLMIEEFIEGDQYSIAALVESSGVAHFCEGIADLKTAQDIGIDDNYLYRRTLPGIQNPDLRKELFSVAQKGIEALQLSSTAAHIELIHGDKGVKLIEIGARNGGYRPRMYKYSYGVDLTEQEIRISLGEAPNLEEKLVAHSAVYELFPRVAGIFKEIMNEIDADLIEQYHVKFKPGQKIGPAKDGFKAVATLVISEEDESVFIKKCRLVEKMSVEVQE